MTQEEELQRMRDYMAQHPCPCGRAWEVPGSCRYSDPLQWDIRCICGREGHVCFIDHEGKIIRHLLYRQ